MVVSHILRVFRCSRNQCRGRIPQSGSADMPRPRCAVRRSWETATSARARHRWMFFWKTSNSCPPTFRKQSGCIWPWETIYPACGSGSVPFYHKPEMADQVAVWGSPQQIADQIVRLRDAGVNYILLNPVFDEEAQMERLCQHVLPRV